MNETLVGIIPNERLIHALVALAVARPDYIEALHSVASVFGLRCTFEAELKDAMVIVPKGQIKVEFFELEAGR